MPTTLTQPTIVWKQYKLAQDGTLTDGLTLSGNTVDYQAVQAGQYSPAICVRPQFSGSVSQVGAIGSIRLWWSTTTANNPSGVQTDLPTNKWVLKYYVSDCSVSIAGDTSTTGITDVIRCAKMLNYLSSSDRVQKVATDTTFQISTFPSNTESYTWCRSTWQSSQDNTCVSMQPVPFSGYEQSVSAQQSLYNGKYGGKTWVSTVLSRNADATYEPGTLLNYAAGGVLTSTYKCNVKGYVNATSNFPYIFFTIKAPSDAAAGTWNGWACRISYIWPYTVPSTSV